MSPFVSGGRQLQLLPSAHGGPNGRQMPSKLVSGAEIEPVPFLCWTTGSFAFDAEPDAAPRFSESRASSCVTIGACTTGRSATTGDSPWNVPVPTCGPSVAGAVTCAAPVRSLVLSASCRCGASRSMPAACARSAPCPAACRSDPAVNARAATALPRTRSASALFHLLLFTCPPWEKWRKQAVIPDFCPDESRLTVQPVLDGEEVEPPRRRGRACLGPGAPCEERADVVGAELDHRPDERAHHVAQEAVGRDLEVEMLVAADPLGALDDAHEHVIAGRRRRERAKVVLPGEQRRGGSQAFLVKPPRHPPGAPELER